MFLILSERYDEAHDYTQDSTTQKMRIGIGPFAEFVEIPGCTVTLISGNNKVGYLTLICSNQRVYLRGGYYGVAAITNKKPKDVTYLALTDITTEMVIPPKGGGAKTDEEENKEAPPTVRELNQAARLVRLLTLRGQLPDDEKHPKEVMALLRDYPRGTPEECAQELPALPEGPCENCYGSGWVHEDFEEVCACECQLDYPEAVDRAFGPSEPDADEMIDLELELQADADEAAAEAHEEECTYGDACPCSKGFVSRVAEALSQAPELPASVEAHEEPNAIVDV